MKHKFVVLMVVVTVLAGVAVAQMGTGPCAGAGPPAGARMGAHMRGQGMGPGGPGMGAGMGPGPGMGRGPMGKWWTNSALVQKLGLNDTQVQKIEKIFQDHRMQLIDLRATVAKQEATMEPLVEAEHPNEAQVTAQIDKIAQARANLEKSNAQMLLAIRQVLTVDQWKQLQNQRGIGRGFGPRGFGPPTGE
ncbi:MAG: periplasmic heavy metal sensor [Terriglobales bacterium]